MRQKNMAQVIKLHYFSKDYTKASSSPLDELASSGGDVVSLLLTGTDTCLQYMFKNNVTFTEDLSLKLSCGGTEQEISCKVHKNLER